MTFQTMLTKTGLAKITNALALQDTVQLVEMAAGDGGGGETSPTQEQTVLVNEVYRANLSRLEPDSENPAYVIAEMVVPSTEGGWYVREVGIYDIDGDMIAIANFPETYKPTAIEGSTRDLVIRLYIEVVNSDAVELKIDPAIILATRQWVVSNFLSAPGGDEGQVLRKKSSADHDIEWGDPEVGSDQSGKVDYEIPLTTIATSSDGLDYHSEPRLVRAMNGDILCLYQRAAAHDDNTVRLVLRRSSDNGVTWAAEEQVFDDPGGYATRNPGLGIDEASGRIIVFFRIFDSPSTQTELYYLTSDDNGATWSSPSSLFSLFTGESIVVPFGKTVSTTNGLMQVFYAADKCWVLFSLDGGLTWKNLTTVYDLSQVEATFTEPFPLALDDNRVMLVCRDNEDGTRYFCYRSNDGGLTWSLPVESAVWTTGIINTAAPVALTKVGNEVVMAWCGRSDDYGLHTIRVNQEFFWQRFKKSVEGSQRRPMWSSLIENGSAGDAEFGYPDLLTLPGVHHTALCAWYDSKTGGGKTDTEVHIMSTPRH